MPLRFHEERHPRVETLIVFSVIFFTELYVYKRHIEKTLHRICISNQEDIELNEKKKLSKGKLFYLQSVVVLKQSPCLEKLT